MVQQAHHERLNLMAVNLELGNQPKKTRLQLGVPKQLDKVLTPNLMQSITTFAMKRNIVVKKNMGPL